MRYASRTSVPVSRSRAEIENLVMRYGADQFGSAHDNKAARAMIQFRIASWLVRFLLPLGDCNEQQQRQRWRALALVIKAKLEAVESGIATIEEEFTSHLVMPDGKTVGEHIKPELRKIRESGQMPQSLLPDYTRK